MSAVEIKRSVCPHDCPDTCGWLVRVEDGRITSVEGDPAHPVTRGVICAKARHYPDRVYSPQRVLQPLRRIGPKGAGRFVPITWDEALAVITDCLSTTVERFGAEAVLPFSYGGTMGVVNNAGMDRRFFHKLGTSRLERTICSAAGTAGYIYTMGAAQGTDPEGVPHTRYIISWGCDAAASNIHQMLLFNEARKLGAKLVVVDVHRNASASQADEFIMCCPGTDAALALGMMHVIVGESLYDAAYVDAHTTGFARLRERLREYPPGRVEQITGVPAEAVRRMAREYAAARPSFIRIGNGPQHHENGGMAVRTIACLPALTGAWQDVGGGALKSNSGFARLNRAALERADLLDGREPRTINMNQLGHALLHAQPPVRFLYVYNSNPAVVVPRQRDVLAGLAREDLFTVVHEQLMTDTARYADIVLPATTHLEHLDLYTSYWHLYVQLAEPVIAPVGESKPNIEVFRLLACAMGFTEPCFQESAENLISQALDCPSSPYLTSVDMARLRMEGVVRLNVGGSPCAPFSDGDFPTPSGKIEFYSEAMGAAGLDPLPVHVPLVEGTEAAAELPARYPLMCVTPPNRYFLNSTFANLERCKEAQGEPVLKMHREDAARRGIGDGDRVRVWNDRGECLLRAVVDDSVLPGVTVAPGLWWLGDMIEGRGANQTTPDRLSDMGRGVAMFSNLVEVELAQAATESGS